MAILYTIYPNTSFHFLLISWSILYIFLYFQTPSIHNRQTIRPFLGTYFFLSALSPSGKEKLFNSNNWEYNVTNKQTRISKEIYYVSDRLPETPAHSFYRNRRHKHEWSGRDPFGGRFHHFRLRCQGKPTHQVPGSKRGKNLLWPACLQHH